MEIRLLGRGDEPVLAALARDEAAFDIAGRGRARPALAAAAATDYLADPQGLHWVAEEAGAVVGHLLCYVQRRRAGDSPQLMLYEIEMERWMQAAGVARVMGARRQR